MMRRRSFNAAAGLSAWPALLSGSVQAAETAPLPRAVVPAYFGMHFHRLVRKPGEPAPALWPEQVTIGSLRLWDSDTRWADLAPKPDRWDFDRMDAYVERATARSASILYTLGSTPRWASARPDEPGPYGPGCAAEPLRVADWVEYLRRVVERYRGVIHAYELWNEPNFSDIARDRGAPGFFTGSVAAMVELARSARQVINEVDPQARLTTPGFVNGSDRLALFLKSGGARWVDVVTYHMYADDTARFVGQLAEVRQVMRDTGTAALPLWNTECGVETRLGNAATGQVARSEVDAAVVMAQLLLLGASGGVERFYYYAWDNGHTGMIDLQGQPGPRLAAFAQVQSWMFGTTLSATESLPGGETRIVGQREGERYVFAWAKTTRVSYFTVPAGWRVADFESLFDGPVVAPAAIAQSGGGASIAISVSPRPLRVRLIAIGGAGS